MFRMTNKNSNNNNFIKDIQNLLKNFMEKKQVSDFNERVLKKYGITIKQPDYLSETDKKQLEVKFTPAKERMELDRAITFAEKNLEHEKYTDLLLKFGQLCISHGKYNLAEEILNKAKKLNRNEKKSAEVLLSLSDLYARITNFEKAILYAKKSQKIFDKINDKLGLAKCKNTLGTFYAELGNLSKAKKLFEESLSYLDQNEHLLMSAMLYQNIAVIYSIYKNFELATEFFQKSLTNYEKLNEPLKIAEARHNLAMVYMDQQYFHSALNEIDKSIEISLENGFHSLLGLSYLNKANILSELKEWKFANAFADKALEVTHGTDDKLTIADIYKIKGKLEYYLGNFDLAENYLLSSLRINKKYKNQMNIAETSLELAKVYDSLGKDSERDVFLDVALQYYKKINAQEQIEEIIFLKKSVQQPVN